MKPALLVLLLTTLTTVQAAEGGSAKGPGTLRIAKFKDDRVAAISMTLDDGLRNQDEYAVPLLNKYGIKATFYVIPGLTPETNDEAAKKKPGDHGGMSWLRLKELAAQGHEIANHTWTHIPLTKIKDGQRIDMEPAKLDAQIGQAYEAIKERIGVAPFTFATPGNGISDVVRAAGHKYHPVIREHCERFGAWPPTSKDFTATQANAMVDRYIRKGDALVWMMHAVTEGYNAFSGPDVLEDHLKYLRSKEGVLWIDTFARVSRYAMERDAAKLTGTASAYHAEFTLACALDVAVFHDPLTIVIPADHATDVEAHDKNSGEMLPCEVRADKILVQAAPSGQSVEVIWRHATK
ncbi:MAG: polysaccharide deacetylase family protein [Opitutales bacterium]|nr:polysaccharide deacetylase family protein [Opitutales bacterium]